MRVKEAIIAIAAEPREVLSREDAAALLGVTPKTVTRLVKNRALRGFRIGRLWRFRRTSLLSWAEAQEEAETRKVA